MKRIKRYVAAAVLTVVMTAGLSSCIYDYYNEDSPEGGNVTLFLRLGILDGPESRAEAPDRECIHSIRIVMLDLDNGGKVEYNTKISYEDNPVISTGFVLIPTIRGKKKIFFIANEESVRLGKRSDNGESLTSLIESFKNGDGGFEEAINAAYFELDPNLALPMTSEYTLTAGRPGENNYTFYVVPVATKYTFNVTNKRTEDHSTITKIAIENLADANYVMPHVGQLYRDWTATDGTKSSLYWIDWLKNVVEETSRNDKYPGNYDVNQRLGWIFDYELPAHSDSQLAMFDGKRDINGVHGDNVEPETVTFGPYYASESKSLQSDGSQSYTLVLELTDGTGTPIELSRELSFLSALFRNTHVVVDITIDMFYMHVYGEIRNWKDNDVYGTLTEED